MVVAMAKTSVAVAAFAVWAALCLLPLLSSWLAVGGTAMRLDRIAQLRQETVEMFYHGYDNYMEIAFPEDEVQNHPFVMWKVHLG
jgi:hypothetical protein